jgi:hypothetical protein
MQAVLRLCEGCRESALLRRYAGCFKALCRLCKGFIKAVLRLYYVALAPAPAGSRGYIEGGRESARAREREREGGREGGREGERERERARERASERE